MSAAYTFANDTWECVDCKKQYRMSCHAILCCDVKRYCSICGVKYPSVAVAQRCCAGTRVKDFTVKTPEAAPKNPKALTMTDVIYVARYRSGATVRTDSITEANAFAKRPGWKLYRVVTTETIEEMEVE